MQPLLPVAPNVDRRHGAGRRGAAAPNQSLIWSARGPDNRGRGISHAPVDANRRCHCPARVRGMLAATLPVCSRHRLRPGPHRRGGQRAGRSPSHPRSTSTMPAEPVIQGPAPSIPVPRERPKAAPATLSPASKALVYAGADPAQERRPARCRRFARSRAAHRAQQSAAVDRDGAVAHGPAQLPAGGGDGPQGAVDVGRRQPDAIGGLAAHRGFAAGPRQESTGAGSAGEVPGARSTRKHCSAR